ncbi:MAG: RNA polymerase sigma factor [Fimbriimonadaceae bacterium]|nr:RNA polymerase sigma factor [Fimbriimonadaceae bacterium]
MTSKRSIVDQARFERLVRHHKDSVYRHLVKVCGHNEDAQDSLALALLQAYKALDQLSSDESFRAWLTTIGKRVCTRMRRSPVILEALELGEKYHISQPPEDEFELAMMKDCIQTAMADLPAGMSEVYSLVELGEYTVQEAADEIGISLAAAKSRLLRARTKVRSHLDQSVCGGG